MFEISNVSRDYREAVSLHRTLRTTEGKQLQSRVMVRTQGSERLLEE
jgi:hypothetical protein